MVINTLVTNGLGVNCPLSTRAPIAGQRGYPQSIRVDNGSAFYSRAMDAWSYVHRVALEFIRPEKPAENGYIESFNGKLRDECLNVELFFGIDDARRKLEAWRSDYNGNRPHKALAPRRNISMHGRGRSAPHRRLPVVCVKFCNLGF